MLEENEILNQFRHLGAGMKLNLKE